MASFKIYESGEKVIQLGTTSPPKCNRIQIPLLDKIRKPYIEQLLYLIGQRLTFTEKVFPVFKVAAVLIDSSHLYNDANNECDLAI